MDPERSEACLFGRRLGGEWMNGLFRGIVGEIVLDPRRPAGATFSIVIRRSGFFIGHPRLNTQLRALDLLGDRAEELAMRGSLSAGALSGEYFACLDHTLVGLPRPMTMGVELWRWEALGDGPSSATGECARVCLLAWGRERDPCDADGESAGTGTEQLRLRLEAVRDERSRGCELRWD